MDFIEGDLFFGSKTSTAPKYLFNLSVSLHFYTTDIGQDLTICCWDYCLNPLTSLPRYTLAFSSLFPTLQPE